MYDSYIMKALQKLPVEGETIYLSFSGGKDSTALLGLFMAARELNPQFKFEVVHSNTLMEMPFLDFHVDRCKTQCEKKGIPFNLLVAPQKDRFHYNALGRGLAIPNRNFRWCTDRLKIKPIAKFVPKGALMANGERLGESNQRDKKLNSLGCSKSNECGVEQHTVITENMLRPLLNWSTCQVWDAIAQFDLLGILPNTFNELSVVYSINETDSGSMRTGCVGCFLVKKDRSLNKFAELNPVYAPLTRVKPIYTRLTIPENRILRKTSRCSELVPGCIKLSARKLAYQELLEIQSHIPDYHLIPVQDTQAIWELLEAHTYPRGYSYDDPQIIEDIRQYHLV